MNLLTQFSQTLFQPVFYAPSQEALIEAGIGVLLLLGMIALWWRGVRTPEYEWDWTRRCLQFTGVFGTIAILLAFVRYEGIPYASMQAVLGLIALWALTSFTQLVLYRQFVLKSARIEWREHKARDQYLPKPKKGRTAR